MNSIIDARTDLMLHQGFEHLRDEIWFRRTDITTVYAVSAQEELENKLRIEAGLRPFYGHTDLTKLQHIA